jgi:uncharacterized protein (TIGR00251 family)
MTSVSLLIHVLPRAGRNEVVGWHGDAVKIKLKAAPVDGAANEELIKFLAKTVCVPRGAVQISSGTRARRKRVEIEGISRARVISSLGL